MKLHSVPKKGFTLIELLVVIGIIALLSSVVYASIANARRGARDDARMADLKSLQLAVEMYRAQYGQYPAQGCGTALTAWAGPGPHPSWGCSADEYIVGLVPQFIAKLPTDPINEDVNGWGFMYISDGANYKILVHGSVETKTITSYNDEFARCPRQMGNCTSASPSPTVYGVYSAGFADR
jgi:prepilin-type N-terminal cleavage/methylation domain-containing protein